jgi:ribosome biogenesis GTPase
MNLIDLGWNPRWEVGFEPFKAVGLTPARVAREEREQYIVLTEHAELAGEISGKFRHNAGSRTDFPAVGDWVAVESRAAEGKATIHGLLPRLSKFSRKVAGAKTEEQIVAANVDTVFIVVGLDGDYNVRRIERYLATAWNSGAVPVIVLNKADGCDDVSGRVAEIEGNAAGASVHAISALTGAGLEELHRYCLRGATVALLGSSGAGKSTLINSLLGENRQATFAVSEHLSRGRHTTTHRELIVLPTGGVVIDNPGMRELQLWSEESSVDDAFEDIAQLAAHCRFRDCVHKTEPGCAVQAALADGTLPEERFKSYRKLKRELRYLASRQDQRLRAADKARWKQIAKAIRAKPGRI